MLDKGQLDGPENPVVEEFILELLEFLLSKLSCWSKLGKEAQDDYRSKYKRDNDNGRLELLNCFDFFLRVVWVEFFNHELRFDEIELNELLQVFVVHLGICWVNNLIVNQIG